MNEQVKLKRGEIGAAKKVLREEICDLANSLYRRTTEKLAIPRSVVDGSLSDVIKYKETAIDAAECYHVTAPPGAHLSLDKLTSIRDKLRTMADVLEGRSHD